MLSSVTFLVVSLHCFYLKDRMQILLVSLKNAGLQVGAGETVQNFVGYRVLLFPVSHFPGRSFLLNVTWAI